MSVIRFWINKAVQRPVFRLCGIRAESNPISVLEIKLLKNLLQKSIKKKRLLSKLEHARKESASMASQLPPLHVQQIGSVISSLSQA
jgi:hypothetical protein